MQKALEKTIRLSALLWMLLTVLPAVRGEERNTATISGKIISSEHEAMDFATVQIKGTGHGTRPDAKGIYHLHAKAGTHTLVFKAMGYETVERTVTLTAGERRKLNVSMQPRNIELAEVKVEANHVSRVNRSAFNAVALDLKGMAGLSKNLAEVLTSVPGVKLRETGGVGSDMQLMLDGFSGRHVKVFIDGVPQEGAGTALDLNNLPVNFAERIEVYRGVVPVGFGTDAIGGVVNIVTNQQRQRWFADASYSYGSFNTHKSSLRFGQSLRRGWFYEANAFQNFSDNDYHVDNYVTLFGEDGITESTDKNRTYRVRRFNDRFHNEAATGKIGVADKRWADRLTLGFTYTHFYKEIQTGVKQEIVFGQKHRHGHSFIPSLEYRKRDLFARGLDVTATVNYNHNITHNIDTASYKYNWLGDRKYTGSPGEQSNQNNEQKNTNWNGTFTAHYRIGTAHAFTLNHVLSTFRRTTRSYVAGSSRLSDFSTPKRTRKNVTGLSYRFMCPPNDGTPRCSANTTTSTTKAPFRKAMTASATTNSSRAAPAHSATGRQARISSSRACRPSYHTRKPTACPRTTNSSATTTWKPDGRNCAPKRATT